MIALSALHRRFPLLRRLAWQRDMLHRRVAALEARIGMECAALDHPDQRYGGRTYAQHGDDLILVDIFARLGIERPSYLDIGAHHPFIISNTALLYLRGSRGINVEANPNLIGAFREHRPEDINLNVGVAAKPGVLTFYLVGPHCGLNSFRHELVRDAGIMGTMKIPVTTVEEIVRQHSAGQYPDLLSIDIEGMDYEVLASIDYSRSAPKVICVETSVVGGVNSSSIGALLGDAGYFPCWRAGSNTIFVLEQYRATLSP